MAKFRGLRSRLFLSHLSVALVSLTVYVLLHAGVARRIMIESLQSVDVQPELHLSSTSMLTANLKGMWLVHACWPLVISLIVAAAISYWIARRVTQPIIEMKHITQTFAAGDLDVRLPHSSIPEINQLNRSFNRMALRLEAVEAKRSEMIGELAHELRTPLTIVRGYLEEWADERLKPTLQSFHQLIREVRRLERLVMDLQILSKAEMGHLPLQLQVVQLSSIFQDIHDIFASQLPENGLKFVIHAPSDLVVWADPDRTQQILVNLIGNAFRHTVDGCIDVQAQESVDQILIIISDTGSGITEADLPHVFERFWRSEQSRMAHPDGSGLGLAIAKRLSELQGGQLDVTSQVGIGTTFTLRLPMFEPQFMNR